MDGVGMVYASIKKVRIKVAANTANMMASVHSREVDFFKVFLCFSLNASLTDSPRYRVVLSNPHLGRYMNGNNMPAACSRKLNLPYDFMKSIFTPIMINTLISGTSSNITHHAGLPLSLAII